jgi:hypothetical protein
MVNQKEYMKEYRETHKEQIKKYQEKYHKEYHKNKKEKIKNQQKDWYIKNKERILKLRKIYYLTHKEKCKQQHRDYYKKNMKKISKIHKSWLKLHNKEINKKIIYKLRTNINFRLAHYLRSRIWHTLKGINKSKSTMKLLGCSIEKLKQHLESIFQFGMSWSNYGNGWNGRGMKQWHIDHIIPCAKFDLSKPEEQCKCFHYTNLQPLWAKENLSKGRN